jgi:hypothetical protein
VIDLSVRSVRSVPASRLAEESDPAAGVATNDTQAPRAVNCGTVVAVRGSVVDVAFTERLPPIYSLLRRPGEGRENIIIEVLTQLDANRVRGVALTPTEGLARGMAVEDTGGPLMAPVFHLFIVGPTRPHRFPWNRPFSGGTHRAGASYCQNHGDSRESRHGGSTEAGSVQERCQTGVVSRGARLLYPYAPPTDPPTDRARR